MRIEHLFVNTEGEHVFRCGRCQETFKTKKAVISKCPECDFEFLDRRPRYKKYVTIEIDGKVIPRYRLILENLGLCLDGYTVHHIDGDTKNDDINNLCLLTREEHDEIHRLEHKGLTIKLNSNVLEVLHEQQANKDTTQE